MALPRGRDVAMTLEHPGAIPHHPLPDGFVIETWQPGDEEHWLRIHRIADHYNDFDEGTFQAQYGIDDREWARCILFLRVRGGATIGTSGAWWKDNWRGGHWGQVHWVAILPGYHGLGLGRALVSATLEKLQQLGHDRFYLSTNTVRANAIRLYESFGFEEAGEEP